MEWYEAEVQAVERNLANIQLPDRPAAFYGSSSIRMWTELAHDLRDSRAVNVGFGGSTLAACVHFFDRLVRPTDPASLVVYAGDNDLGDGRSPEDVLASFRELAALVDRLNAPVPFGFISIKLSPSRVFLRERINKANELVRVELKKHPRAYYIDVHGPMLDSEGRPRAELFLDDGLHLSPAGYRIWTRVLEAYRNRIFTPLLPGVIAGGLPSSTSEP